MRVKLSIFAEDKQGRVYSVSRSDRESNEYLETEPRLFLDSHFGQERDDDALQIESSIDNMVEHSGIQEDFFRNAGTHDNRPSLVALPNDEEKGRLRVYGYRRSNELLLLGGGCFKYHDETLTAIDDFPECRRSANLIQAVFDKIEWYKSRREIFERTDGYYDDKNELIREKILTIPNAFL